MNRCVRLFAAVGLALGVLAASARAVVVISQENFSLGYGTTSGTFITNETASANTPATAPNANGSSFTLGDYQFTVNTAGLGFFSSQGPTFNNRVLGNDAGNSVTSQSSNFTVTISAVYTGPSPLEGGFKEPTFSLAIDQISLYSLKHPSVGTTNEIWWTETTAGHGDVSPSVFLNETSGLTLASNYKLVSWDPGDWVIDGTNVTRTFRLPNVLDPAFANFAIDGLEIIGFAQVTAFVPEPSTVMLLGVGGLALAWWRRRR